MKYRGGKCTGVVVGCIDSCERPLPKVQYHVYVKDKPEWYEITDDAPQYQEFSPGFKESLVESNAPTLLPKATAEHKNERWSGYKMRLSEMQTD